MILSSKLSLLLALGVGGLATLLTHGVLQNMAAASQRDALGRSIVVAKAPIASGMTLTPDKLRQVPWRSDDQLEGSFASIDDVLREGRRLALQPLQRNEPILASRITAPNQRATLSTQLEAGMRAVAVRVDEVRGVAGFVTPGDRVDLILTRGESGNQDATAYADVLLQNAKVLAVDQLADERQDKPTIARAVTLEVSVQQAQKIVLAQGIGRISLALRQANNLGDDGSERVTASDLGVDEQPGRDRVNEVESRLNAIQKSSEAAQSQANKATADKLAELEARMRGEIMREPALNLGAKPAATRQDTSKSVINVIRNGSKLESYTVSAER